MARGKKKEKELTPEEKMKQALVPVEEQPYEVPDNWCWTRLGRITEVVGGGTPSSGRGEYYEDGDIPWISPSDLSGYSDVYISKGAKFITKLGLEKSSAKLMPTNTVCLSSRAPVGYVVIASNSLCTNQGFKSFLPSEAYIPKYLYWYLKGNKEMLESKASGTTFLELSGSKAAEVEIPLAPIPEQQRIVDRIESLFAKLDEAKEKAQAVVDGFEDRKAAILHKALTGELTEEWRNKTNQEFKDYIKVAREKRDSIIKEKRVKKLKYTMPDDIYLPDIPNEWQYIQMGDIAWSIKDGPHYSPEYVEEGIPFITGGNVRPTGVDFENAKKITKELHEELSKRCHPEKGDMLYTKGGTTGIARVNTYDVEFSVWVHVAVIKYVDCVLPEYFQMALNSPLCYEQSQKYTHGVGNQDLGLTRMINIIFPVCSITEQKEIVQLVNSLIGKEQKVKEASEQVIDQIDVMKKSILARAFRGELGTNDPTDENAVELLKRIL